MKTVFRYPGGKSKMAVGIIKNAIRFKPLIFVDGFVGGGSVSVECLNSMNSKVVMNDLDRYIYSFWNTLCEGKQEKIIDIIEKEGMPTIKKFVELRSKINDTELSEEFLGFLALFFNRTAFSGIFRSGPIGGYDQSGKYKVSCRYNKSKIIDNIRLMASALKSKKSECTNNDFREVINKFSNNEDAFLYLDPPYMKQGHQLYSISMEKKDYEDMADLLKNVKCKWIVSHDDYLPFVNLFKGWSTISNSNRVPYTINSIIGNRKTELLISNFDFPRKEEHMFDI